MVQKRPFGDEESYEVSYKHPRQLEYSNQLVSFLKFVPAEDTAQPPNISGEGDASFTGGDEKHAGCIITELPICTENYSETSFPGCISNTWSDAPLHLLFSPEYSNADGSFTEGDEKHAGSIITELQMSTKKDSETSVPGCISNIWSDAPLHLLFSPEYANAERPIRTLVHSEEICTSPLECRPRKLVPIGPDFQVDVPEWGARGAKNVSNGSGGSEPLTLFPQASESDGSDHNGVENKLAGICVIPMSEFGSSAYNGDKVGDGRTDCYCEDSGSFRCVRQHIKEAREKLWRTLGQERFLELGFSDMGEVVADKWSREEELLFREVIFSNPASLGNNFWDHLSMVFPSRAKKDIVSYYFNVFMLQRRAVQNRCDPPNIDSDDDEWQGSDDSGDDEVGTAEEDEDSVVEFPLCRDDLDDNEIQENDSHEFNDGLPCADFNNFENIVGGCDDGIINVPGTCSRKLLNNCGPDPTLQLPGKFLGDKKGDDDVQDDTCTSGDTGTASQLTQVKANNSKCRLGSFNSVSSGDSHESVLEHYDNKVWDVGYFTCPKNEVEFLPTCNMIEEVFGVGAWNYPARDC